MTVNTEEIPLIPLNNPAQIPLSSDTNPPHNSNAPRSFFSYLNPYIPVVNVTPIKDYASDFNSKLHSYTEITSNKVRTHIQPWHETGNVLRLYGMADALNISFSLCSLVFMLSDAAQHYDHLFEDDESAHAANAFHAAEKTNIGLALTTLFTVSLMLFSALGSHYDKDKDSPFLKYLFNWWPYVRTVLKQIKWWTKGFWALFSLLLQYGYFQQDLLIQIFFPLAAVGSMTAAVNAFLLRSFRDGRKKMVTANLAMLESISSAYHELDALPDTGYQGCFIRVKNRDEGAGDRLIYKSADGDKTIEIEDWSKFDGLIKELQIENIHTRMKDYLNFISVDDSSNQGDEKELLIVASDIDDFISAHYVNSYLWSQEKRCLYVIESGSNGSYQAKELARFQEEFDKKFQEVICDKNILRISDEQLATAALNKEIISREAYDSCQFGKGQTQIKQIDTRFNMTHAALSQIKKHSDREKNLAVLSSGASSLGDGLYYYLSIVTKTTSTLSPSMSLFMLDSALFLFCACFITRIAEELDYQRRLEITDLRVQLELQKNQFNFMHQTLLSLPDDDSNFDTLWSRIADQVKECQTLQDDLEKKYTRSYWAASVQGLQNGLAVQGALSSFSFMVSTLCASCPPVFILSCLCIGLVAILFSVIQGIVSHYIYLDKLEQKKNVLKNEFKLEDALNKINATEKVDRHNELDQYGGYLNNQALDPPVDFVVIEWSEIFRLLFKGAGKGKNASEETTNSSLEILKLFSLTSENNEHPEHEDRSNKCLNVMFFAFGFGMRAIFAFSFGMRATVKGFAVGRPDAHNSDNLRLNRFEWLGKNNAFRPETEETLDNQSTQVREDKSDLVNNAPQPIAEGLRSTA